MQTNAPIVKKLALPRGKRLITLYDTQAVDQGVSTINFFPANASRKDYDNNYITNPLPGNMARQILGVSFEATLQVITTKANIDPVKIINGLKRAAVTITSDQNEQKMLRALMSDFFNFKTTGFNQVGGVGTGDAVFKETSVELRSNGVIRLADPFQIGAGQNFNVKVEFKDASLFPTVAHWTTAGIGDFCLQCKLYVAEDKA